MSGDVQVHVYLKHGIVVYRNRVVGLVYLGPLMKALSNRSVKVVKDRRLYVLNLPPHLNETWARLTEGSALGVVYLDPSPAMMDLMNNIAKALVHDFSPRARRYPSIFFDLSFKLYNKSTANNLVQLNDFVAWRGITTVVQGRQVAPTLDDIAKMIMRKLGTEEGGGVSNEGSEAMTHEK